MGRGDFVLARDLLEREAQRARDAGQAKEAAVATLGLASCRFELGEAARALKSLEEAAVLAHEANEPLLELRARSLRARVDAWAGLHDRAKEEAEQVLKQAQACDSPAAAAHAVAALGDVAFGRGEHEAALMRYDDAIGRSKELGASKDVAGLTLRAAEVLLDRDGASDGSAAAARLAEARSLIDAEALDEHRLTLRLLLARARAGAGDVAGATAEVEAIAEEARKARRRELEWRALAAGAALHALRGADFVARRHDLAAVEVLESIAAALPREMRDSFWRDPRRREIRSRAAAATDRHVAAGEATFHGYGVEQRAARLLEIIKRLASEHDLERLLERITDSAVELSGAERGIVLLTGDDGQLEPRLARRAGMGAEDPSVAFSRSIAEAVLIDGEAILTVDARDDARLSEYLSVHKLMLKSVACMPIHAHGQTHGVLYLEHRMRRGRFRDGDLDLLVAFADQAAIALQNAKWVAELERRREELETKNRELAEAKAEIERVLVARTTQLEETRLELDRARGRHPGNWEKYGIVGNSEAIRRVFAVIDRVRDTNVPVVIQGESGTGKELVARAIHFGGTRSKMPFVALNCAAVPENLLESELFGHVRGAFTGADRDRRGLIAQASGGTLFLDEVGDMPAKMQVDLLRVLQERRFTPVGGEVEEEADVRIVSASNKSLRALVETGEFREDLYYRLDVVDMRLPPLRERAGDIPLLVNHFLTAIAKREGRTPKRISRDALTRLAGHPLPGNVRQLEHLL